MKRSAFLLLCCVWPHTDVFGQGTGGQTVNPSRETVIDNFESYDDNCNRIFYAWKDGLDHPGSPACNREPQNGNRTGAQVGRIDASATAWEKQDAGPQAMSLSYNNLAFPFFSEVERAFVPAQDWTQQNGSVLSLWTYGFLINSSEPFYIALEDSRGRRSVLSHDFIEILQFSFWNPWPIPLHLFDTIDLKQVNKMAIGIGHPGASQPGQQGTLLLDDITLMHNTLVLDDGSFLRLDLSNPDQPLLRRWEILSYWPMGDLPLPPVGNPQTPVLLEDSVVMIPMGPNQPPFFVQLSPDGMIPLNWPWYGYTLGIIDFNNPREYFERVRTNNTANQQDLVQRIEGQAPDPNGFLYLYRRPDRPAQAKGRFAPCWQERILVRFKYLFTSKDVALAVYISGTPFPGDRGNNQSKLVDVVYPPVTGRPGAVGSGRYGEFEAWAETDGLDLSRESWLELELIPAIQGINNSKNRFIASKRTVTSTSSSTEGAITDDWALEIHCDGYCMDLTGDVGVDFQDFLIAVTGCGRPAELVTHSTSTRCLEGSFSRDGFVDAGDLPSWDWVDDLSRQEIGSFCPLVDLPLADSEFLDSATLSIPKRVRQSRWKAPTLPVKSTTKASRVTSAPIPDSLSDLLVLSKSDLLSTADLRDGLFVYSRDNDRFTTFTPAPDYDRLNTRLVRGCGEKVYIVNTKHGLLDLCAKVIVGPSRHTVAREPRYQQQATVTVGLQGSLEDSYGRPLLDAACYDGDIFVVPVVVTPEGHPSYLAAARIKPDVSDDDYLVTLYAPALWQDRMPRDNPNLNGLRDIEVDNQGTVYLLNVYRLNESTQLSIFDTNGTPTGRPITLDSQDPNNRRIHPPTRINDPVGFCLANTGAIAYMASGQHQQENGVFYTTVYALATESWTLERKIRVSGMQHLTGLIEDPQSGNLWAIGFNLDPIPATVNAFEIPRYMPVWAIIQPQDTEVSALTPGSSSELALPTSILWTAGLTSTCP